MQNIYHNFLAGGCAHWRQHLVGSACLEPGDAGIRLITSNTSRWQYTDAQLDDAYGPPRPRMTWLPPLRLTLRARFSHSAAQLRGTAGFGFWNYPSLMPSTFSPALPRAVWFFFASPPTNLKLDMHIPGHGWKAATVDTQRGSALRLLPLAPLAVPLMNLSSFYRCLWPRIQRAVGVQEAALDSNMTEWHIYTLDWGTRHTRFSIDGQTVLEQAPSPGGPLCFVLWVDNQYAIVTPWGRLGWGLLDIPGRQWLEVEWLSIER
jgi:hypothetical protein